MLPLHPSLVLGGSLPVGLGPEPLFVALGFILVPRQAFLASVILGSSLPMPFHVMPCVGVIFIYVMPAVSSNIYQHTSTKARKNDGTQAKAETRRVKRQHTGVAASMLPVLAKSAATYEPRTLQEARGPTACPRLLPQISPPKVSRV